MSTALSMMCINFEYYGLNQEYRNIQENNILFNIWYGYENNTNIYENRVSVLSDIIYKNIKAAA